MIAETDAGNYRFDGAAPDPALVAVLAGWCAGAGRLIVELRTSGGTLEEVYLDLVGEEQRDDLVGRVGTDRPGSTAEDGARP